MRHFIAYHNVERMGRHLHEGDPLALLTNKPVQHLLHNAVWFIVGEGSASKQYSLGSFFIVNEIGETGDQEFKRYARGQGHVFQPPIPLNDREWFRELLTGMAHFSLGVQATKNQQVINELIQLASQAGCDLAPFQDVAGDDERRYPDPKQRELSDEEKQQLSERLDGGDTDIYQLAEEFGCSSSQVAGIKAAMSR